MRVEWLRAETSSPADVTDTGNEALAESLRDEISKRGPVTFAHFMERALYDSKYGYYALAAERPTREGDFLTAPELHPIFGRTLARQVEEMWQRLGRPKDFTLREYGAGTGALFVSIVEGLEQIASDLATTIRYEPIDFARQRARIQQRLVELGRETQLVPISERKRTLTGVVIANEYLDAQPVHRVIQLDGTLRKIHVDWRDDHFVEVAGPAVDERVARWFNAADVSLAEGQRAEVNLRMLKWVEQLSGELARGYVMVIDYGARARELYSDTRLNGTIRAFSGQRVSADVLSGVGQRDITSSVDFDAYEREARVRGFEIVGLRRSNEFLIACGLDDVYARARTQTDQDWEAALTLRSAIQRLLDPNALGGYLVSILAKNAPIDPQLLGFTEIARQR